MSARPSRPVSERPEELGFTRQNRMVPWLSPRQLTATALKVVLSAIFGAYADKREVQACLEAAPPRSYAGDLWVDYVADLGDAFGPTYSVASLLAAETLDVDPTGERPSTRRGQVLVMGGDQIYPTASIDDYVNKVLGPYRAALPYTEHDHPHLYAVPGNHDWYDGLTAFMRVFCQGQWVGGWQTQQSRSYFALQLPHRWWLWGIDIQFDTYIDRPQFRYFDEVVGAEVQEGDSIILCAAVPSWVDANEGKPEAYVTLDYLERMVVRKHGAGVRLALGGDSHHYARYEAEDGAQKITAGGGGAYLSATHHLPEKLELPPAASRDPGKTSPPAHYELQERYPSERTSRRLRWGVAALPARNAGFWALIGVVYLLYAWMIQDALRPPGQDLAGFLAGVSLGDAVAGLLSSPLALLASGAVVGGLMVFTKSTVWWKRLVGAVHGLVHLALIVVTIALVAGILANVSGAAFLVGFVVLLGVGGGLLGSWLMAAYLLLADKIGCNTNELFSAQPIRDYKNFLRLHLDSTGTVTVYPLKVERTGRRWRLRRGGDQNDPWFEPTDRLIRAELIEEPVRVEPACPTVTASGDLRRAAR